MLLPLNLVGLRTVMEIVVGRAQFPPLHDARRCVSGFRKLGSHEDAHRTTVQGKLSDCEGRSGPVRNDRRSRGSCLVRIHAGLVTSYLHTLDQGLIRSPFAFGDLIDSNLTLLRGTAESSKP